MAVCVRCEVVIPNREYLICSLCKKIYDIDCANVSSQRFYNTMTKEHKDKWTCKPCLSKPKKMESSNSLPRSQIPKPKTSTQNRTIQNSEPTLNMSLRPRSALNKPARHMDSESSDVGDQILNDRNISGDTMNSSITLSTTPAPTPQRPTHALCLEDFKTILNEALEQNKQTIISDMKSIIQQEISIAINKFQEDILRRTHAITKEQTEIKKELSATTKKIQTLESENKKLETELKYIQTSINNHKSQTSAPADNSDKKIVLHGLDELYGETELNVQGRLLNIFRDIMSVNLHGYIEDTQRIGRRGNKRPLVIELLSKSMTRYLLQNCEFFKNTGLSITKYLDEDSLKIRRNLTNALREARRERKHAIIRNNKLIINGRECSYEPSQIVNQTPSDNSAIPSQQTQDVNNRQTTQNHSFRV
ncbi:uncharacterized protein LOC134800307 [Cydia splendana]|uniref:uncharacterized protein LOC134800307 n=1 Tax=Cydia splendana TaxID=1100963 RepID=UPI00300D1BBC